MAARQQGMADTPQRPARKVARQRAQTHYERLGVRPDAAPAEIRAAYVKLMKRHHPDVVGDEDPDAPALAINQAYHALSDPIRRGRYDATLGLAHTVVLQPMPIVLPPPRRRTQWGSRFALLAIVGLIGCYAVYATRPVLPNRNVQTRPTDTDVPVRDTIRSRRAAVVQQAGLNFEWIALQSDAAAAERYSQQCWNSLLASGSDGLFDYCLAFDAVAEGTFRNDRAYFTTTALLVRARAASAGRLQHNETLAQRIATVNALLARDRRPEQAVQPPVSWFPIADIGSRAR